MQRPQALTATAVTNTYALATCNEVVGGTTGCSKAYYELRIDRGRVNNGSLDYVFVGSVLHVLNPLTLVHSSYPCGFPHTGAIRSREGRVISYDTSLHRSDTDTWFMSMKNGSLYGNGKEETDMQGEGSVAVGDRLGVLIDTGHQGQVVTQVLFPILAAGLRAFFFSFFFIVFKRRKGVVLQEQQAVRIWVQ